VVALEGGYLQTIVDAEYDRRLIVTYDATGSVRTATTLAVPLGLMLGTEDRGVYGARHIGMLELVRYSYTWRARER
jgi:hypothetical protein